MSKYQDYLNESIDPQVKKIIEKIRTQITKDYNGTMGFQFATGNNLIFQSYSKIDMLDLYTKLKNTFKTVTKMRKMVDGLFLMSAKIEI